MKNAKKASALFFLLPIGLIVCPPWAHAEESTHDPLSMEFRRLAVQRFVFNNNLPLCEVEPTSVVALDLMHPIEWDEDSSDAEHVCKYAINNGLLEISNDKKSDTSSTMLIGGFNPFAVYDINIQSLIGEGAIGVEFSKADFSRRFIVGLEFEDTTTTRVVAACLEDDKIVYEENFRSNKQQALPCTLRVQMLGTGVAIYMVSEGNCKLAATIETKEFADFRRKDIFTDTKFRVVSKFTSGSEVTISSVQSYLSCGVGESDIRMVTLKDGAPYWKEDRLWFLMTARGWRLPHSTQAVYSLDPTVFEPRYEGLIVFDYGDGLLRNDVGTHIFYDDEAREWRGWSCNFSTVADGIDRKPTGVNLVWSKREPLKGFSVMKAKPLLSLEGINEDPCGVWDEKAGKWRLLVSSFHEKIRASLYESDNWDGPYTRIAGPVSQDSTGTLIQTMGDTRYVFSGSADQAVHIYSYPGLELLGDLKMDYEPWDDTVANGRVWPNIFQAPAGHPYPYLALMMDRANYPGLNGWTYGALYLYGAVAD